MQSINYNGEIQGQSRLGSKIFLNVEPGTGPTGKQKFKFPENMFLFANWTF